MSINNNSTLITGAAGFIGAALSIRLLKEDFVLLGLIILILTMIKI